jgi:hypothetical protein
MLSRSGSTGREGYVGSGFEMTTPQIRKADPWLDTDVIDERGPRFNQAVTGLVALAGLVFGWPLAWALMAVQLAIGLTLGRRYCLPCLAYFLLIQPRLGEGRLEDSRPPRFANLVGVLFLGSAALAWWLGAETLGSVLAAVVAGLALLSAATGFCAGCWAYRIGARWRGISRGRHDRLDPADLVGMDGAQRANVEFTHPLCAECREWEERLAGRPEPLVSIDVTEHPELARKYGIAVVPTVLSVAPDGTVVRRLAP